MPTRFSDLRSEYGDDTHYEEMQLEESFELVFRDRAESSTSHPQCARVPVMLDGNAQTAHSAEHSNSIEHLSNDIVKGIK